MTTPERLPRVVKIQEKVAPHFSQIVLLLVFVIWGIYFGFGFPSFNKSNAVSIFSSVIQGMSALLSVSIAVIIFRIQSLENRNQQLEESTLNFIFQTTKLAYPKWIPSLEVDIRNKAISKRYYESRAKSLQLGQAGYNDKVDEYHKDENLQQTRLEETLQLHTMTGQTIQRIRSGVITSIMMLIMPIMFSFLFLMVSDAFDVSLNFVFVSIVVLMSAIGIAVLIKTVLESTTK